MSRSDCRARRRKLGHRARRPSRPRRPRRAPVGARPGAGRRDDARRARTPRYLPDIPLPTASATARRARGALDGAQFVVVAVPSHGCARSCARAAPSISRRTRSWSVRQGPRDRFAARACRRCIARGDRGGRCRSSCCRARASPPRSRAGCRPRCWRRPPTRAAAARVQDSFAGPASGSTRATTSPASRSAAR